jgi:hypothetical protein
MRAIGRVLGAAVLGFATIGAAGRGTSLSVSPLVTELRSSPGTPDRVVVNVINNGDRAERVVITPLDWHTADDGSVRLQQRGANGERSLTQYVTVNEPQFPLAPGARHSVLLTVDLPARIAAPRSLWGGVLVKATDAAKPANAMGPASTVFVYDDIGSPRRHLAMDALRMIPGPGGTGIVIARVRNDGDAYARTGAHLTVAQAGRIVVDRPISVGAVFPDATRMLRENVAGLRHGPATVSVRVDYGGDVVLDGETSTLVP